MSTIQLNGKPIGAFSIRDLFRYLAQMDIDVLEAADCNSVAKIRLALVNRYLALDPSATADPSYWQSEVDREARETVSRLQGNTGNK